MMKCLVKPARYALTLSVRITLPLKKAELSRYSVFSNPDMSLSEGGM